MDKSIKKPPFVMDKEKGKQTLLEVAHIFDTFQLNYFLVQGTALGAYRDKGFTPTEADIDFGFLQEDFSPASVTIVSELMYAGFEVRTINRPFTKCRTIVADRDGVHLDLVSFVKWRGKRFVSRPMDCRNLPPYSIVHSARMIESYDQVELFGRKFQVPWPVQDYLRLEYGSDWQTPKHDHISRTRIYNFVNEQGIPHELLDA